MRNGFERPNLFYTFISGIAFRLDLITISVSASVTFFENSE